jgi:hypothetical protein
MNQKKNRNVDIEKEFLSEADNYLTKPFSVKQIGNIIKKYLGE